MTLMAKLLERRYHIKTEDWPMPGITVAGATEYLPEAKRLHKGFMAHPSVKSVSIYDSWQRKNIEVD